MNPAFRPLKLIAIAVIVSALMAWQLRSNRPELVTWPGNFDAAQARSRAGGGPVLAYFTATWCVPCQKMKSSTFADERVDRALSKYSIVKIDFDQQHDLAMKYHAESIPMFAVLDNDGNVKKQTSGYMTADEFLAWLNS